MRTRFALAWLLGLLASCLWAPPLFAGEPVSLWHSYRGSERAAIDELVTEWNAAHPDEPVVPLALPYDAFANKLTSAIPHGHGPDLFIAAHERVGDWAESGLIAPLSAADLGPAESYYPQTLQALSYKSKLYGWPLAYKSAALYVNTKLLGGAPVPQDDEALLAFCEGFKKSHPNYFCLAYEAGSFYHHAAFMHGFGGGLFDAEGRLSITTPENAASFAFATMLVDKGYAPQEPTAALVSQLFNEGRAAFALNGPWMMGEIEKGLDYTIAPIVRNARTGRNGSPYLTVEALLLSSQAKRRAAALRFARYLAEEAGARKRATIGAQAVAFRFAPEAAPVQDAHLKGFAELVGQALPMPNLPIMRTLWEPLAQALRKALRHAETPANALEAAKRQIAIYTRPTPPAADPAPFLLLLGLAALAGLILLVRHLRQASVRADILRGRIAYTYIAPAALALVLLVFIPFVVGTAVSLFAHNSGTYTFVGLSNFKSILSGQDYGFFAPLSFYFTLLVTVLWTSVNVVLHVSLGLFLALFLREPWLKLRGLYRVLLIIPWAVPNYITALIWKGMFHKQFGAINGLLSALGLEPVSWFSQFSTAFAANVATNTWLGFPFMMVVTLGALQAIPRDLEEAAEIDGAGPIRRFFSITLPLLRPALLPAVILGSVWTFNMFNIIFLVSGGEPDGQTEILISEAYRWAFTRQEQYGYAAAYATLIFLVLLLYSGLTRKLVKEA